MDREPIIRAQVAALLAFGGRYHPLTSDQALLIAITEIENAAARPGMCVGTAEEIQNRLTLYGIRAIYLKQAGQVSRDVLIQRIHALPKDQATAWSLRYEHDMSDWQIAETMNIAEDDVVALMLRALVTLTGGSNDAAVV